MSLPQLPDSKLVGVASSTNKKVVSGNVKIHITATGGASASQEHNGTRESVLGLMSQFSDATELYFEQDGATARLTRTYITDVTQTLEIDYIEVTGSIFKNPYYVDIDRYRIKAIERVLEYAQQPDVKDSDVTAKIAAQSLTAHEQEALNLLLLGTDSYEWVVPEITWTRAVDSSSGAIADVAYTGKILSSNALGKLIGTPIYFAIPSNVSNIGLLANASFGWMAKVKANIIANGAAQLIYNFKYAAWDNNLYSDRIA